MLIKITNINKNETLGEYPAVMITGERVDGKGEWSKKFFDNNQTLMSELEEFGIGETVNVRMTKGRGTDKSGRPFWNIAGFEEASADLIASVSGGPANPSGGSPKSSGAGGYTKSSWNGRTGEAYDRSASVYLAWDIVKTISTDAELKKDAWALTLDLANEINNYIHNGDDGSDPLSPPSVN